MKLGNRLSPVKPGFWKVASGPIFECNIGVVEASAEGCSSYRLSAIGYRLYGCYVRQRTVRHVVAQYDYQMLHEFLTSNRNELIKRCREKVAKRYQPLATPAEVDNGVPLFLQQLTDTLRREQVTAARDTSGPQSTPANSDVGFAAALHGAEMLRLGFSVDQVVHEYGDVCQSVTDMAVEQKVLIAADQFRTLNRCLDDAIADAVSAYGRANQTLIDDQADNAHARLRTYAVEHRRLVDIMSEQPGRLVLCCYVRWVNCAP